jgi:WD40 repeat protein
LACAINEDVRLYDLGKEAPSRVVTTHDGFVTSVEFSKDGASVFSASHDHTVQRVRLSDGAMLWRLPGNWEQVSSIALSQDASLLATGSGDVRFARGTFKADAKALCPGSVRLWDARTGRLLRRLGDPNEQVLAVTLTSDGRLAASGGVKRDGAGIVHLWDSASGKALWSMNDHQAEVLAVATTTDGSTLATASADGEVKVRDIRTGEVLMTVSGHTRGATSVLFSNDGSLLITGAGDGETRILDARTGLLVQTCKLGSSLPPSPGDRLFNSIGLSHDGTTLASCTTSVWNIVGAPARIWNGKTGTLQRDFAAEKIHGRPIALSPDGSLLATGGKSVKLYDVKTGELQRELFGHLKRTQCIQFSADGRLLFAGGNYGTTNAWEVATGRHLATLFTFRDSSDDTAADDWLAATPEGFYDGTEKVERYLSWRVGDEIKTPGSLRVKLHRPDRVEQALNLSPVQAVPPSSQAENASP